MSYAILIPEGGRGQAWYLTDVLLGLAGMLVCTASGISVQARIQSLQFEL